MGRRAKSKKVEPLLGDLTLNEESTLNQNGSIASPSTARTKKERKNTKRPRGPRANSKWVKYLLEDSTLDEDDTYDLPRADHPQEISRPRSHPTPPVVPELTFPYFSLLPAELRTQIWDLVLASDPPSILRVHYGTKKGQLQGAKRQDDFHIRRSWSTKGTWTLTAKTTALVSTCHESRYQAEKAGYEIVHLAQDVTQRQWFNFRNGEAWFTANPTEYKNAWVDLDGRAISEPVGFPISRKFTDRFTAVAVDETLWLDWVSDPDRGGQLPSWSHLSYDSLRGEFINTISKLPRPELVKLLILHVPQEFRDNDDGYDTFVKLFQKAMHVEKT
ncbi:hypothetical protein ACEPPN_008833 [Leptodophora sp. 'Broadleaf-Isolate-01']